MKKSKESLRKKVDVFVMTRIGRLLVNRGERPKGPKVVIIIILSITGVVRSIKNRKQIIAKYWDVWDLRQLKDCQFGLNLFWGNGTSWETNGKMYLFAFFGVDLKFAVSIWAYFPLNHHSIQQTALHTPQTLVLHLQDYLTFSSSLALIFDQLELSCQTQLHGSKLKKWIEANLINWVYITTNHILLMLKGIVETKKKILCFDISFTRRQCIWKQGLGNISSCEIFAAIPAFVGGLKKFVCFQVFWEILFNVR